MKSVGLIALIYIPQVVFSQKFKVRDCYSNQENGIKYRLPTDSTTFNQLYAKFKDNHGLLIIQGVQAFYICGMNDSVISDHIKPRYDDCDFSDLQGTYVRNLKVIDGTILQLVVDEYGMRNFNLTDIRSIKEI